MACREGMGPPAECRGILALGILRSSRWATWGPRAGRRPGVLARGVPGSSVLCSSAVVAGGQCQLWGKAKNQNFYKVNNLKNRKATCTHTHEDTQRPHLLFCGDVQLVEPEHNRKWHRKTRQAWIVAPKTTPGQQGA